MQFTNSVSAALLQALRSGVINGEDSYRFEVPSSYREVGVANIQSGNFCMVMLFSKLHILLNHYWLPLLEHAFAMVCLPVQPNCGEPWTEVIFADDKEGKIQVECPATLAFKPTMCLRHTQACIYSWRPLGWSFGLSCRH